MKKYFPGASAWLLLSAVFAFGQTALITVEEYAEAVYGAQQRLESVAYRQKTLTKEYTNGKPSGTVTVTVENLPPGKFRELTVKESGGVVKKHEKIVIGDFEYSRADNGEWKKYEKETILTALASREVCRQHSAEEKAVGSQKFRVFGLYRVYVWEKKMTFEDFRTFIDAGGLIQKTEIVKSEINPGNITSETTRTYEYDPKDLRIEAPVK